MRIAICADIHDNIWVLERALAGMQEAEMLVFCGDFCAPFTLAQVAEGFAGPVHVVWGNNDGDKWLLTSQASRFDHVSLHGDLAEFQAGGVHIAANHYPEIAQGLARSGKYDVVCYGHDHQVHDEKIEKSRLINPGELMGRFGKSTFVILDTETGEAQVREVENPR